MPRYQIRMYKPHDLDLMELVARHRFCLQKAAYCCLAAFVEGKHFVIRIPELREEPLPAKKVYARTLRLSGEKEKDREIIRLLNHITPGYRNNFIKNLLRLYLMCPATGQFFRDPKDLAAFAERYQCLRKGKPLADAASFTEREPARNRKPKPVATEPEAANGKGSDTPAPETRKAPDRTGEKRGGPAASAPGEGMKQQEAAGTPVDARFISPDVPLPGTEEEDLTDLFSALI